MLVLGHGAGSSMTSPFLTGFCEQIAGLGVATHRFDFPYMRAGRKAPDRAPVLIEAYRQAWSRAVELAAGLPVFAGGRSMGGRIASMAAAEGMPIKIICPIFISRLSLVCALTEETLTNKRNQYLFID